MVNYGCKGYDKEGKWKCTLEIWSDANKMIESAFHDKEVDYVVIKRPEGVVE